ncbi:hypothetical protein [Paludisphaera soli]|uniref:hypothetical protein n=1 Tax=Paludisphaera soli TaxID=2712865 RepID=UPI0013EDABB5|nr:hypothetical protein [Paludisphaera soli]
MSTLSNPRGPRVGRAFSRLRRGAFLLLAGLLELVAAVVALAAWVLGKVVWLLVRAVFGPPAWVLTQIGRGLGRFRPGTRLFLVAFAASGVPLAMMAGPPRPRWVEWALVATCFASSAILIGWATSGRSVATPEPKPKRLDDFA